jgi:hypothetical protein
MGSFTFEGFVLPYEAGSLQYVNVAVQLVLVAVDDRSKQRSAYLNLGSPE